MALSDARHHRSEIPRSISHAVRVYSTVEQSISLIYVSEHVRFFVRRATPGLCTRSTSSPLKPGDRERLACQLLRRQQPLSSGAPKCESTNRIAAKHRIRTKPAGQDYLDKQVFQIVRLACAQAKAAPECSCQSSHLGSLGTGSQKLPFETGVFFILGRDSYFATHDGRPPELHCRLGEMLVLDDASGQPLKATSGVGCQLIGEAGLAHVPVPSVALDVAAEHHVQ